MFTIGIQPTRTSTSTRTPNRNHNRNQRRTQLSRVPIPQSQSQSQSTQSTQSKWLSFFYNRRWNLLHQDMFVYKGLYFAMSFDYSSFAKRYAYFMNFSVIGEPETLIFEAQQKFFLNQRLRFQFKRLISFYLYKKMKIMNEIDPITLEIPRQPVVLVDHANRCKFQFEAMSLLRDFSTRLLTHEDLFPKPLYLRNPFTNAKLHLGQILSLYHQIKSFGYMHWTLECYQDAEFLLNYFIRDNMRKLRLSAVRSVLQSSQNVEVLLDFIEAQHDLLDKPCDFKTYKWALTTNKCDSMTRIRSWKSLCLSYYEIEITEEDVYERQRKKNRLAPLILPLCSPCIEIQMVRMNSF